MFDFEKLEVYQICKHQNIEVVKYLDKVQGMDPLLKDLWKKTSLDVVRNLVEGVGRIPKPEKKEFITMARGYVFECVAFLNILNELMPSEREKFDEFYNRYESLSKMLLGMIRSFDNNN